MSNLAQVDLNLGNTPKRLAYLRGYGRIQTLETVNTQNTYYPHGRLQPLCGKFGEHLPSNTVMESPQTTIAWDSTVPRAKCTKQNEAVVDGFLGVNSQLPADMQVQQAVNSVTMPAASYYSTDGVFHDGKC
jgi:hypothetical protein